MDWLALIYILFDTAVIAALSIACFRYAQRHDEMKRRLSMAAVHVDALRHERDFYCRLWKRATGQRVCDGGDETETAAAAIEWPEEIED